MSETQTHKLRTQGNFTRIWMQRKQRNLGSIRKGNICYCLIWFVYWVWQVLYVILSIRTYWTTCFLLHDCPMHCSLWGCVTSLCTVDSKCTPTLIRQPQVLTNIDRCQKYLTHLKILDVGIQTAHIIVVVI